MCDEHTSQTSRRSFLRTTAVAAAGTALGSGASAHGAAPPTARNAADCPAGSKTDALLRLSAQEGPMPGETLTDKIDNMERWGYEGLELYGKGLPGRVKEIKNAIKGRPVTISAICAGFEGWLIAQDAETRQRAMRTIKEILTAGGELGAVGMIVVPAFNNQPSLPDREARKLLTGFPRWDNRPAEPTGALLAELADHAHKAGTRVLLEPLNREECYFLRTLASGASICRDLQHPGLAMMGDFWHMTWEETSDLGAFISAANYLKHVHIASRRTRKMPGEDGAADHYVDGMRGLKWIGYRGFISLECGCKGDRMKAVPAAAELIRRQWAQA